MQPFEEQENPSFASVAEPPLLQRPHCDQSFVAIADYECQRCIQRFCKPCQLIIHHRLVEMALKNEESKGDGRPHQEFLKWISGAEDGPLRTWRLTNGSHAVKRARICISASIAAQPSIVSSSHISSFAWKLESYVCGNGQDEEGDLQDRGAVTNTANVLPRQSQIESLDERCAASMVAHIKLEEAGRTGATVAALNNLTINGSDLRGYCNLQLKISGTKQSVYLEHRRHLSLT
ncbi:hypothetical protein PsorP6_003539 [Peronosclerospora sorghi]|uniref:Uncharacterized protein n=1 Tax=Peronosclerospora sorghi TaxID=230839 RepID=A0ACC0VNI7_9STRA|nr:hypothetical protein PsorP6_003539 [Peronosclerospora sorghi]